jgi:adenine-specific DNA-methyltransferase
MSAASADESGQVAHALVEIDEGERISAYADRIGRSYLSQSTLAHRKRLGQYLTPLPVADYMASLCDVDKHAIRILDPGAGTGVLTCAVCERLASLVNPPSEVSIDAYEADAALAEVLESVLRLTKKRLAIAGIGFHFNVHADDFIIANATGLEPSSDLFRRHGERFDLAISNPPYFKLSKSDPRARAADVVVHGQPNIYALFMAVSASMLAPGGEMIFITPRSFTSGPYFRCFREWLFERVRPEAVHVFESRRQAFDRDGVLQENIILKGRRDEGWASRTNEAHLRISSSVGSADLGLNEARNVPLTAVLDLTSAEKVLRVPSSRSHDDVTRLLKASRGSLKKYALGISTGRVVAFRASHFLAMEGRIPETHAPLLWMQNVHPMQLRWPVRSRNKEQFISVTERSISLLVPDNTYVLLRRFSAKEEARRLVAAPLIKGVLGSPFIGLENHLNYIHRPGGSLSLDEAWGLAALLNSSFFDMYFRSMSGNTQVSATEMSSIPLPPLEMIAEIGAHARSSSNPLEDADALLMTALRS